MIEPQQALVFMASTIAQGTFADHGHKEADDPFICVDGSTTHPIILIVNRKAVEVRYQSLSLIAPCSSGGNAGGWSPFGQTCVKHFLHYRVTLCSWYTYRFSIKTAMGIELALLR